MLSVQAPIQDSVRARIQAQSSVGQKCGVLSCFEPKTNQKGGFLQNDTPKRLFHETCRSNDPQKGRRKQPRKARHRFVPSLVRVGFGPLYGRSRGMCRGIPSNVFSSLRSGFELLTLEARARSQDSNAIAPSWKARRTESVSSHLLQAVTLQRLHLNPRDSI